MWQASLYHCGKTHRLGTFSTPDGAAKKYDIAVRALQLPQAFVLNLHTLFMPSTFGSCALNPHSPSPLSSAAPAPDSPIHPSTVSNCGCMLHPCLPHHCWARETASWIYPLVILSFCCPPAPSSLILCGVSCTVGVPLLLQGCYWHTILSISRLLSQYPLCICIHSPCLWDSEIAPSLIFSHTILYCPPLILC